MTVHDDPLADDFPAADEAQWRALVEKALKGADFERRMVARTYDGIRIEPLSRAARGAGAVLAARAGRPWSIAARVDHPDPAEANRLALSDLQGGADALVLVAAGGGSSRGFGVDPRDLARVLDGVMLDLIRIRIDGGFAPAESAMVDALIALAGRRGHAPGSLAVDCAVDAATTLLEADLATSVGRLNPAGLAGALVACDARPVHEAGGSEAQELAYLLALAAASGRALTEASPSLTPAEAFALLSFTLAVDADQLLVIAKLRALRYLMARLAAASGVEPQPVTIHAETAWRMLSRRDPAVNMLRATVAVFSAVVGGADQVAVLPHTAALGLPDALARRIARNTQLVLLEEAGLATVADPAAGSGAIEALTDSLARAAWALFQDIERAGGIAASLASGHFQGLIAATRAARLTDIATRRTAVTGTSEFPTLAELPATVLAPLPGPSSSSARVAWTGLSLPSLRLAEPFEVLRDRADAHQQDTGRRPRLFLAALGPLAEHSARTLWVTNAVAAGGIEAVAPADGFASSSDAGRAFAESGAGVAIITGTDETYALLAEATAGALKAAGARAVWLAGRPGGSEATLRTAGVDGFLHAGQNLIEALARLQRETGIDDAVVNASPDRAASRPLIP